MTYLNLMLDLLGEIFAFLCSCECIYPFLVLVVVSLVVCGTLRMVL